MFGGNMPDLHDLTDAKDWGEAQMPEVLRRLNKDKGEFFGNPVGQANWWDNSYDSAEGKFNIYITPAPKTVGNSNSYSCRLIPKEHMVDCYPNNYDALVGASPET